MTTDDMRQPNILVTGNYFILNDFSLIFFLGGIKFLEVFSYLYIGFSPKCRLFNLYLLE